MMKNKKFLTVFGGLSAFAALAFIAVVQFSAVRAATEELEQNIQTHKAEQKSVFFRIGTGPAGGAMFTFGGLLANALSNPPGSRPCSRNGNCGVPGMIAIAQTSFGGVANVAALGVEDIDAALIQADVAQAAYDSTAVFAGSDKNSPVRNLRLVARLYGDVLHIVVPQESSVKSVADLKGLRVSLGARGSGTLETARAVLKAHGLGEKSVRAYYQTPHAAAIALKNGQIDAMFVVDAVPVPAVDFVAKETDVRLIPVDSAKMAGASGIYRSESISGEFYNAEGPVETIGVDTVLVVSKDAHPELVYSLTEALWHDKTQAVLKSSGLLFDLQEKSAGLDIPHHDGAVKYYSQRLTQKSETSMVVDH